MKNIMISQLLLLIMTMNVMIGAGIFVYPSIIADYAQSLGFLSFGLVFLIMLPLVVSVAQLAAVNPAGEGGFYLYSAQTLGRAVGILNALIYFIAKAISCSIMIRTFVIYLYSLAPGLISFPVSGMRILAIFFLFLLNLFGIRIGARIQCGFIFLKLLPIVIVIMLGLFLLNFKNLTYVPDSLNLFISSLPFAFYPLMGFETCCAIGHTIGDARKIAQTVLISFFVVTCIYMLFQFFLFGSLGIQLVGKSVPLSFFFISLGKNCGYEWLYAVGVAAVMTSALGAAYGILYANSWYIFVIGRDLKIPMVGHLTKLGVSLCAVIIQAVFIALLLILPDNIAVLGKISVFGVILSYIIAVLALLDLYKVRRKELILPRWVALLGLVSCVIMALVCIKDLF